MVTPVEQDRDLIKVVEAVVLALEVLLEIVEQVVPVVMEDNYHQHSMILDSHHQMYQIQHHIKGVVV